MTTAAGNWPKIYESLPSPARPRNWRQLSTPRLRKMAKKTSKRTPDLSGQRVAVNAYYSSRRGSETKSPFEAASQPKKVGRALTKALDLIILGVLLFFLTYSLLVSGHARVVLNDATYQPLQSY